MVSGGKEAAADADPLAIMGPGASPSKATKGADAGADDSKGGDDDDEDDYGSNDDGDTLLTDNTTVASTDSSSTAVPLPPGVLPSKDLVTPDGAIDEEDDHVKKYMQGRAIYDCALESVLASTPFETYNLYRYARAGCRLYALAGLVSHGVWCCVAR